MCKKHHAQRNNDTKDRLNMLFTKWQSHFRMISEHQIILVVSTIFWKSAPLWQIEDSQESGKVAKNPDAATCLPDFWACNRLLVNWLGPGQNVTMATKSSHLFISIYCLSCKWFAFQLKKVYMIAYFVQRQTHETDYNPQGSTAACPNPPSHKRHILKHVSEYCAVNVLSR